METDKTPGNILIVDDNLDNLRLLTQVLSENGYQVRAAKTGKEALVSVRNTLPDLVLLDIKMPDMNGYEVCGQLKSDKTTREVPVIFLSSLTETVDKIHGFKAGGIDYITKPFEPEEVLTRVQTHINLSRMRAQLEKLNRDLLSLVEQLNAKNNELKSFNYTVSHDLKAPLRGIIGYSEELTRKHSANLTERGLYCVNQVASVSRQLDNLIEDMLKLSRLETEMLQRDKVRIKTLVEQILNQRRGILEGQNLELTSEIQDVEILGSASGLLHAISNLVDNAIKYSSKEVAPKIHIFAGVSDNHFKFVITDNGIGFDMKYHDRLFELFHRLVRQEEFEGTGAGLAIVKKIIDKHHGRIWGESEPGKGATFTFVIPVGT